MSCFFQRQLLSSMHGHCLGHTNGKGGDDRSMKEDKKQLIKEMERCNEHFATDPNGSYTGKCVNEWEVPVQDADDL